jgi:hypothetical protein
MSALNVQLAFVVINVLWGCVFVVHTIKASKARGDDRRRYARLSVLWSMGFCVTMGGQVIFNYVYGGIRPGFLIVILSFLGLALVFALFGLRSLRSDSYSRKLYDLDPGFCGRCGYNLTGNTTGVCSECGWELPDNRKRGSSKG